MSKRSIQVSNRYWWEQEEPHDEVWKIIKFLNKNQTHITDRNVLHMRLYGNMDIGGFGYREYALDRSPAPQSRIKLNVCKSVVDTVVSKLTRDTPRVMFVTDGGNHTQKQRAKKLTRYVEGVFYELEMQEKYESMVRDGGVFDNGYIHHFIQNGRLKAERVFPDEILVDEAEAIHGNPRSLFRYKPMDRNVALSAFGTDEKQKIAIERAKALAPNVKNKQSTDMIEVAEAWHLPNDDGEGGRHVICIEGATLFAEEWKIKRYPFTKYEFGSRLLGWHGQGIIEQLVGIQIEINTILKIITQALKFSVPKILKASGSKVSNWSNLIMGEVTYSGVKPTVERSSTVSPELFNQLENLYSKAYEIVGLSQLSAQAKKPSGLDSKPSLREYMDIESDRFTIQSKGYQRAALQSAWLIIELSKKLAEEDPNFAVKYDRKGAGLEFIKWKDVEMDENHYQMKMYPVNMLPRTPSGRMAYVQEMAQAGYIKPEDAAQLLEFPDIESVTNLYYSHVKLMDKTIEDILENGNYNSPEPFQVPYIEFSMKRMNDAYLKARLDNVPEEKLELMRKWIKQAKRLVNPPAPPQLPGGPQAVPEQPPVSDLLPNAPVTQ